VALLPQSSPADLSARDTIGCWEKGGAGLKALVLLLIVFISSAAFPVSSFSAPQSTSTSLVNPLDGSNDFNFTTVSKSVGDVFTINVTVTGVTALAEWQVHVGWDDSLLSYASIVLPSDNVFAGDIAAGGNITIEGPNSSISGSVLYRVTAIPPAGGWSFNGTGTLAVLTLQIIQGVGIIPPTRVSCPIQFLNMTIDTYLKDIIGNDIGFTAMNGVYNYVWYIRPILPSFFISPSTVEPDANGDQFSVDIMVQGLPNGWEVTLFQFSIMWNTTLMEPAAPTFNNGTFLESFEYAPNGVTYATKINVHDRKTPLTQIPDDYNFSTVTEMLLPDPVNNNTYHSPYPDGDGKLGTFWFKAIYGPFPPVDVKSKISFIAEDFQAFNHYNMSIGYDSATDATYLVPRERDINVSDVTISKTVVGQGYTLVCNISVGNNELIAESYNLSVYGNTTSLERLTDLNILGNETILVVYVWNTSGYAYGNYTVSAIAERLPGETHISDNNFTCATSVHLGVAGDVSSSSPGVYDGVVNMKDIAYLIALFNTRPSSIHWDPNSDVNNDGVCNMRDIAVAVANFNKHE
jgi:hypothetical protein